MKKICNFCNNLLKKSEMNKKLIASIDSKEKIALKTYI